MKHEELDSIDVTAWEAPVKGAELLDEIHGVIQKYIACEQETSIATSLYILFTWCIDAVHFAPIACITAPEKQCGKSTLLTLMGDMVKNPYTSSNSSVAYLYNKIDTDSPTILIDEADTFLNGNEEMRGLINAGIERKLGNFNRMINNKPKTFKVFGAKIISGIGHLPDTIKDRSILLELRRKLPDEKKERFKTD